MSADREVTQLLQELLRSVGDIRERLISIEVRAAEASRRIDENRARIDEVGRHVDGIRARVHTFVAVAGLAGALVVSLFNHLLRRLSN